MLHWLVVFCWCFFITNKENTFMIFLIWTLDVWCWVSSFNFLSIFCQLTAKTVQCCHGPGHMTVSHGISGSWDLDITRSCLWSDFKLVSDFRLRAWRFSQKSLILYIRLSCILSCCWLSSMSWWSLNWNWISFIELTATTSLWSIISACWMMREWEGQNSKLMNSI